MKFRPPLKDIKKCDHEWRLIEQSLGWEEQLFYCIKCLASTKRHIGLADDI